MLWFAETLPKQGETLQGTKLYVIKCVKSFVCGLHGLVQPHVVAGSTLYGFVQITPESNSMNVVVCRNPSQTR
jgi:hypothetical protein